MDNDDIIFHICSFLEPYDLLQCSRINKQFHDVVKHNFLWKKLCQKSLSYTLEEMQQKTYYDTYKLCKQLNKFIIDLKLMHTCEHLYNATELKFGINLYEIPSNIGLLTNLKSINLQNNFLLALPVTMRSLTNLQEIDLSGNTDFDFHNIIFNLPHLTKLIFNRTHSTEIPLTISKLTKLEHLEIMHTIKPFILPPTFPLRPIPRIGYFPDSLYQMTNLKVLRIDGNDLSILPDNITQMTNLTCLTFSFNNINKLPENIGNLTQLQTLYMGQNPMNNLPDSFTKLTNLTWFQPPRTDSPLITGIIAQMPWIVTIFP